jgi:hypothetical protein
MWIRIRIRNTAFYTTYIEPLHPVGRLLCNVGDSYNVAKLRCIALEFIEFGRLATFKGTVSQD